MLFKRKHSIKWENWISLPTLETHKTFVILNGHHGINLSMVIFATAPPLTDCLKTTAFQLLFTSPQKPTLTGLSLTSATSYAQMLKEREPSLKQFVIFVLRALYTSRPMRSLAM